MTSSSTSRRVRAENKTPRRREDEPDAALAQALAREETPAAEPTPGPGGKLGALVALLSRPEGATLAAMIEATGWQAHSVRGAMSGALKRRLGLIITSAKTDGERTYRIEEGGR